MKTYTVLYIVPSLRYTEIRWKKVKAKFWSSAYERKSVKKTQINKQDSNNKN